MFFATRSSLGDSEKNMYQVISAVVGVIYIIYWLVVPFAKPDPTLLIDEYIDYEEDVLETMTDTTAESEINVIN